jgi:hypothetical protein
VGFNNSISYSIYSGIFQLKRLLYENSDIFELRQLPEEDLRWVGLIADVTLSINRKLEKGTVEDAIAYLHDLDLLDVKRLTQMKLIRRKNDSMLYSKGIS